MESLEIHTLTLFRGSCEKVMKRAYTSEDAEKTRQRITKARCVLRRSQLKMYNIARHDVGEDFKKFLHVNQAVRHYIDECFEDLVPEKCRIYEVSKKDLYFRIAFGNQALSFTWVKGTDINSIPILKELDKGRLIEFERDFSVHYTRMLLWIFLQKLHVRLVTEGLDLVPLEAIRDDLGV